MEDGFIDENNLPNFRMGTKNEKQTTIFRKTKISIQQT